MDLEFPPGFAVLLQGQRFTPTGQEGPRPGTVEWQTTCPDCSDRFTLWTKTEFAGPTRRCESCRAPRKVAFPRATRRRA